MQSVHGDSAPAVKPGQVLVRIATRAEPLLAAEEGAGRATGARRRIAEVMPLMQDLTPAMHLTEWQGFGHLARHAA